MFLLRFPFSPVLETRWYTNAKSRGTGAAMSMVEANESMSFTSSSFPFAATPPSFFLIFFLAFFLLWWWACNMERCRAQFMALVRSTMRARSARLAFARRLRPRMTKGCGRGSAGANMAVPVVTASNVPAPICTCVRKSKAAFIPYTFNLVNSCRIKSCCRKGNVSDTDMANASPFCPFGNARQT